MITIIVGTNRPGANSRKVAHFVRSLYEAQNELVCTLDLMDLPAAIFEPAAYAEQPEAFAPFAEAVVSSKGLHLVLPEYNGGFPGVLKYFIDMLPFPESFEERPVAFTGVAAGQFGALRPVEQIQQIFAYRNAYLFPKRVFIMGVDEVIDDAGGITDAALRERLEDQVNGFAAYVN